MNTSFDLQQGLLKEFQVKTEGLHTTIDIENDEHTEPTSIVSKQIHYTEMVGVN